MTAFFVCLILLGKIFQTRNVERGGEGKSLMYLSFSLSLSLFISFIRRPASGGRPPPETVIYIAWLETTNRGAP